MTRFPNTKMPRKPQNPSRDDGSHNKPGRRKRNHEWTLINTKMGIFGGLGGLCESQTMSTTNFLERYPRVSLYFPNLHLLRMPWLMRTSPFEFLIIPDVNWHSRTLPISASSQPKKDMSALTNTLVRKRLSTVLSRGNAETYDMKVAAGAVSSNVSALSSESSNFFYSLFREHREAINPPSNPITHIRFPSSSAQRKRNHERTLMSTNMDRWRGKAERTKKRVRGWYVALAKSRPVRSAWWG